jgi:hypothetical protein
MEIEVFSVILVTIINLRAEKFNTMLPSSLLAVELVGVRYSYCIPCNGSVLIVITHYWKTQHENTVCG